MPTSLFSSLEPPDPPSQQPQFRLFVGDDDAETAGGARQPSGRSPLSPAMELRDFWQAHIKPVCLLGRDQKTLKEDLTTIGKWERYAGRRGLRDIDRPLLSGFYAWLTEPPQSLSPVTAGKHLSRLLTFLAWAGPDRGEGLNAELLDKVPRVKVPKGRRELPDKAFTLAEIGKWLDVCYQARPLTKISIAPPAWWQSIVLFDYACPLRFETLTAFRWEWLKEDEFGWWIKVPAEFDKKDCGRLYYLSSHAWRALEILGPRRGPGAVFGLPLTEARLYVHAKFLREQAGIIDPTRREQRVFHGLRSAAETELTEMGCEKAAKFALGHAVGRDVTMGFYTHRKAYAAAMERMRMPEFTPWREPQLRLF